MNTRTRLTCALLIAFSVCMLRADAQTSARPSSAAKPLPQTQGSSFRNIPLTQRAREYYAVMWGVDMLSVRAVESGEMVRFTYRVLDPRKAAALSEKKAAPFLIDEKAGVKLSVPQMEKIGELRQSSTPEFGKTYWMVFANKGKVVKQGDHVSVAIGRFKADGLVVQ